jgi:hypothetical protein
MNTGTCTRMSVGLAKYVEGVIHWLETKPPFSKETERSNARQEAEEALRIYRGL